MQASFKAQSWLACAALFVAACGARTDDVGGKTSWLSACEHDSDCGRIQGAECIQHLCTKVCETNGCGQVEGTECTSPAQSCLSEPSCLPKCDESNDCTHFGAGLTCQGSVCVQASCIDDSGTETTSRNERDAEAATSVFPNAVPGADATDASDTLGETHTLGETLGDTGIQGASTTIEATTTNPTSDSEVIVDGLTVPSVSTTTEDPTTPAQDSTSDGGPTSTTDVTTTAEDCAQFRDSVSQRPHPAYWGLESDEPILGEAGCEGSCGYVYVEEGEYFDLTWRYDETLVCPLQLTECADLEAALDANPARCNSVDDCLAFQALTAPCEPVYGPVPYFDSALFTVEERTARQSILAQLEQRGCRDLFDGFDGPTYELACEDNLCTIAMDGDICGGLPPDDEMSDGGS